MSIDPTKPPIHVSDNDYEVGYRKPPEYAKFKKGVSGNPKGRPKEKELFVFVNPIKTMLRQPIAVAVDLTDKKMPLYMGFLKILARKGLKGDIKAIQILFNQSNGLTSILDEEKREATAADRAFIDQVRQELKEWTASVDENHS